MVIRQKVGNISALDLGGRHIDPVAIEWHEANKRILTKKTKSGREILMKFLGEGPALSEGDVLWQDEKDIIVVEISCCEAIVVRPTSTYQMAAACYEIGNRHLPLFYNAGEILVPFEAPLFKLLVAGGYHPARETRKLLQAIKTTVSPHREAGNKQSLFSKILQLTTSADD
jgi:urease accessory protein